ncbi:hypothetical protein SmJEL517_g04160 [Synchytrium microbalum]|uniref:Uncharacterized protein n=1 Tax=Synchytrium microbalum TaxID=1806994 RepID=A0A507BTF2_9FUNG|nr:uncharacterized protein SmJEL517_g04160 [Synchytrium microbalum]TPX32830.1 hypothetical protein SmJEL517_g04160 [Synchytrium microbalum]
MSDSEASDAGERSVIEELPTAQPAPPGTTAFHFVCKSKLGFVQWKDSEASLYGYFERTFKATTCTLKLTESLEQYCLEIEVAFEKIFKKGLAQEIDRIHGIPTISKWKDVRLMSSLGKAPGTTDPKSTGHSSMDLLVQRLGALRQCGLQRQREIDGVLTQWEALKTEIYRRLGAIDEHYYKKCVEEIVARLELVQNEVLDAVKRDLGMIGAPPAHDDDIGSEPRSRMPTGGYGIGGGIPLSVLSTRPSSPAPSTPQTAKLELDEHHVNDTTPTSSVGGSATPTSGHSATTPISASVTSPMSAGSHSRVTSIGHSKLNPTRDSAAIEQSVGPSAVVVKSPVSGLKPETTASPTVTRGIQEEPENDLETEDISTKTHAVTEHVETVEKAPVVEDFQDFTPKVEPTSETPDVILQPQDVETVDITKEITNPVTHEISFYESAESESLPKTATIIIDNEDDRIL